MKSLWVFHFIILDKYCLIFFNIEMWTYNIKTFMGIIFLIKILMWPSIHMNFVVLCFCKININYFHALLHCLFPEYIHRYLIKHQKTLHDTYRIIVPYILFFQGIKNFLTIQYAIFDEGKKLLRDGWNINFYLGLLDWYKPWNFEKRSLLEK